MFTMFDIVLLRCEEPPHLAERAPGRKSRTQCARVVDEFAISARCVTVFCLVQKLVMAGLGTRQSQLNSSPPPEGDGKFPARPLATDPTLRWTPIPNLVMLSPMHNIVMNLLTEPQPSLNFSLISTPINIAYDGVLQKKLSTCRVWATTDNDEMCP